jgi:PAS domain S-box-containing protein
VSNADTKADVARGDHEDVPSLSNSRETGHFVNSKHAKRPTALLREAGYFLLGLVLFATVTGLYFWLDVPLVAAAFTYLVVLVLLSLVSNLASLIVLSFIGVGCLSYFFAPPIYSFRVDYPRDIIAISTFLITSFVINVLVTRVRVERETLRDANQRLEVANEALRIENLERKRAEQALRESEAKIRRLVDSNVIGIFIWDFDGRFLEANDEFLRMVGYDRDELLAGSIRWTDLTPPDWRDRSNARMERGKSSGRFEPFEKEYTRKDGSRMPVLIGGATFVVGGNQGVGFVFDLTERKRAEDALRESEAKFSDYAATASDWFWEIGADYKFTLLSENAFGSGAADRIGTACWDHALDFETEPEKWWLVWATLDSHKAFRDFVYRGLSGTGSPMYVRASGKPVFDANGEFHGYRGTGADVTALMRAQEALRESERSARSAIDGIAGLVAVMAPNGELETVNRQVFEYFGRPLDWLKNWGTNDAVHPEDLPGVIELVKRGMASGSPYHFEERLRRFDGEYRWFDNRGVPIRDDSGRIERWYVLLTDIEDRTRALARLDQMRSDFAHMNRVSMMGELAASLSHEITQPIASARNNARAAVNFLDRSPSDLSEVREALGCVVGDTDRAGDIVDRIRDHIKKTPPRKAQFDLNEAINEVIVLGRSAIIKNGVSVQTRLSEGLFPILGDRVQLQQVVLNLILNAAEAMGSVEREPRELLISTEQHHRGVLVVVADSGPGIDPAHLDRVFEAFYTTKPKGTGMGLSICRSIIDAHRGRLWAAANEPRGTIFQFTLPAVHVGA